MSQRATSLSAAPFFGNFRAIGRDFIFLATQQQGGGLQSSGLQAAPRCWLRGIETCKSRWCGPVRGEAWRLWQSSSATGATKLVPSPSDMLLLQTVARCSSKELRTGFKEGMRVSPNGAPHTSGGKIRHGGSNWPGFHDHGPAATLHSEMVGSNAVQLRGDVVVQQVSAYPLCVSLIGKDSFLRAQQQGSKARE